MKQFIEAKKLDSSTVVFHFDGEVINKTDTASSLDMDDGDCIDVTGYDWSLMVRRTGIVFILRE